MKAIIAQCMTLFGKPKRTLESLLYIIKTYHTHKVISSDVTQMIEGVIKISQEQVRDIMIPRAQMTYIKKNQKFQDIVSTVMHSKHSRFPIIAENKDNISGIILAKDLLKYINEKKSNFNIDDIIRPTMYVPESKKLDNLLNDFQIKHHHMAIVVDEYGGISGLVTIEDILEKIVGDIEDENFTEEDDDLIVKQSEHVYKVKGSTTIEDVNATIGCDIANDNFDTIGGFVAAKFGKIPAVGKSIDIHNLHIVVKNISKKQILNIQITKTE